MLSLLVKIALIANRVKIALIANRVIFKTLPRSVKTSFMIKGHESNWSKFFPSRVEPE